MDRRRLRGGAGAGRRARRLPGPPPDAGGRGGARRHGRARRPAGAAVTMAVRADRSAMSVAAAAATLGVLVWRLGTGPFLDGLGAVDGGALAAASGLTALTTVCCAWRWRIVARGLGVELPLGTAGAPDHPSIF